MGVYVMNKQLLDDYTIKEILACFYSRQLNDGERITAGVGLDVVTAGVLLAHLSHGPNMKICTSFVTTNLFKEPYMQLGNTLTDFEPVERFAEYYMYHDQIFESGRLMTDSFVVGGLQIDKYGNTNLIGVGKDYKELEFRGPGSIGTPFMAHYADRYYIYASSHDKRTFVEECDYISAIGWNKGGKDARKKLGIPGGGPIYVMTPLCIMDFEEETKHMRLRSLHPGVHINQVIDNTGFDLIIPDKVPETELPTKEEIEILRYRIDIEGKLRV